MKGGTKKEADPLTEEEAATGGASAATGGASAASDTEGARKELADMGLTEEPLPEGCGRPRCINNITGKGDMPERCFHKMSFLKLNYSGTGPENGYRCDGPCKQSKEGVRWVCVKCYKGWLTLSALMTTNTHPTCDLCVYCYNEACEQQRQSQWVNPNFWFSSAVERLAAQNRLSYMDSAAESIAFFRQWRGGDLTSKPEEYTQENRMAPWLGNLPKFSPPPPPDTPSKPYTPDTPSKPMHHTSGSTPPTAFPTELAGTLPVTGADLRRMASGQEDALEAAHEAKRKRAASSTGSTGSIAPRAGPGASFGPDTPHDDDDFDAMSISSRSTGAF